jgi:alkanesulfonate monooxygenase SsuD/methylene tetrahydromethanopterin reductase-like flavin-dependent oxidoreductase (luciferase family)
MFDEALAVLLAGLSQKRLNFAGTHYQYHDVPMELHPLQQPYPPLWYPTHTPSSVEYAGRHGFNFVGLGAAAAVREHTEAYRRAWNAHRQEPGRLNGHVAETAARAAHQVWYRSITQLWHEHGDHSIDGLFAWETAVEQKSILFGSPARVREDMKALVAVSGCNYVICSFAWGTLSAQQSLRSLGLFADEVMPAFAAG